MQLAALAVNGVVLMPTIVFRAGGAGEFMLWAVFASVLACGVSAILQGLRAGRIGAGYALTHVSSAIFIAVCAEALVGGGPGLLATLVVVSALAQVAFSARLSLLHRLLTPIVTGTVIMLLPVTVMPILFDMLNELPPGAPAHTAPLSAGATIFTILLMSLKGRGTVRLWAPAAGIVAGSLVGALLGIYDTARVADAAWLGIPPGRPPAPDLGFGPPFWALLPTFLFVALVGSTKSVAVAVAAQRVAWRRPRAVDFRAVQRAVAAEGTGNLLAGLAGTMPNTPHAGAVAAVEVTGAAARGLGVAAGLVFLVLACLPKALAVILAIPGAVVAASIAVVMATLFTVGMREVVRSMGGEPPQRPDRGCVLLDRSGVRIRLDLPCLLRRVRWRSGEQRADHGGTGGAPPHGAHGAAEEPIQGQARRGRAAPAQGVHPGLRRAQRPGGGRGAARCGERGNVAHPHAIARGSGTVRRRRPRRRNANCC